MMLRMGSFAYRTSVWDGDGGGALMRNGEGVEEEEEEEKEEEVVGGPVDGGPGRRGTVEIRLPHQGLRRVQRDDFLGRSNLLTPA